MLTTVDGLPTLALSRNEARVGGRPSAFPVIGSAHIPRRLNRCSSVTTEPILHPCSRIECGQAGAEEHARRRARFGVVIGQTLRLIPTPSPAATDSIRYR